MSTTHEPVEIFEGDPECLLDPECAYDEQDWPCTHVRTLGLICRGCSHHRDDGNDNLYAGWDPAVPWPCEHAPSDTREQTP